MGEHDELLRRYVPRLRYDSNEQYFADSPAQWTENPGNELRRTGGRLIARAPDLTLGFLGAETYLDGQPVAKDDFIGDPKRDYRAQYVKLRIARPELKNRVHGHAVEAGGRVWLQYWLWYFYNDYSLALGAGLHEGDWEGVMLRMHDDEPDLALYAQHTHAEKRPWHEVEKLDGHPLVYVARGSHASYFEAGFHTTEAWYDLADGKRKSPDLELEILDGDGPGWALWPGRWGDTHPMLPGGIQQPSPTGPGAKKQWKDPGSLLDTARVAERRDAPEGPEVAISRAGDWMRIDFDFERHAQPPRALVVTVNSRDEDGVPPRTYTFTLEDTVSGSLKTRIPTDPRKHYDVYTSTTAGDPAVPSESTLTELDPVGSGPPKPPLGQRVALGLSKLFAWVRGHLPGRSR
ncbi:MAG: hypothetical protein ABI611_15965 [Solirubrobacteraceae bacterium]